MTALLRRPAPPATLPGLSMRDRPGISRHCLFGFGCSPLSWILVLHYTLHPGSHEISRNIVTLTRASCQHWAGRGRLQAGPLLFIHKIEAGEKELYLVVFLLCWRVYMLHVKICISMYFAWHVSRPKLLWQSNKVLELCINHSTHQKYILWQQKWPPMGKTNRCIPNLRWLITAWSGGNLSDILKKSIY